MSAREQRFVYAFLACIALVIAVLLCRGETKAALGILGLALTHAVAFVSGVGIRELLAEDD